MNSDSKILPIMKNKIDQLDTKTNVLYVENIKNKDERKLILKELENIKKTIDGLSEESISDLMTAIKNVSELISDFPEGTDIRRIYEIITGISISDNGDSAETSNQRIQQYIDNKKFILDSIDKLIEKLDGISNEDLKSMKTSTTNNNTILNGITNTNLMNINQTITGETNITEGDTKMTEFTKSGKNLINSVIRLNNITGELNDSDKIPNVQDLYTVVTGKNTIEEAKNDLTNYDANETKNLITKTTPLSYNSNDQSLNINDTSSVTINYTNPITFNNNGVVFTTESQDSQTKINNKEINIRNDSKYLNLNSNQLTLKLEKMNTEQIFNNVKNGIEDTYSTMDILDRRKSLITAEAVNSKFQDYNINPFKLIPDQNLIKIYNSKFNSSYNYEFNYDPNGNVTLTEGPVLNNLDSTSPLGVINTASQKLLVNDFVIYQNRFIDENTNTPISVIKCGVINFIDPITKKQTSITNRFNGKIENQTIYIGHDNDFRSFNDIKDTESEYFTFNPAKISSPNSVENFLMKNIITDEVAETNKVQYVSLNFYYKPGKLVYNKNKPNEQNYYVSEYTNYLYNDCSILSDFKNFSFPCDIDFIDTEFANCIGLIFKNDYSVLSNLSSLVYPRNYIRKLLNIKLNTNITNFVGFIRNLDIEEITFVPNSENTSGNKLVFSSISNSAGFINNSRNLKIEDYIRKYAINQWKMADGFDSHNIFSQTGAYNFYGYSIFKGYTPEFLKNITILEKKSDGSDIIDFSLWNPNENPNENPLNSIFYKTFENFMYNGRIKVPKIKISSNNGHGIFNGSLISEVINLNDIDVSNATDISDIFRWCINMDTINIGKWDLSNVTIFNKFLDHCINLTSLTINSKYIDLSNLSNLSDFYGNSNNDSYGVTTPFDLKIIFPGNATYIPICSTYSKTSDKYTWKSSNNTYKITEVSKSKDFNALDPNSRILTLTIASHVEIQ